MEIVAYGANHQARFLVDQERAGLRLGRAVDRLPELQQVVQVPLQLFERATDARGPGNHAHAVRYLELGDGVAQLVAVLALDPARDAATARIVRHQHQVAAGKRDVGGQRGAFVTALVLVNLDDQLLPVLELILDAALAAFALAQVVARDFLERQKAVAVGAVVDKTGFETGLDASNDGLVDIALALFLACGLDIEVDQFLAVDDRHPEFLRLGGIEQHAFHCCFPGASIGRGFSGR